MSNKILPAQKEYISLMNHYWFIYLSYKFRKCYLHSKDKRAILTGFVIALMNQQLGEQIARKIIRENRKLFIAFFIELEGNNEISKTIQYFKENPDITIDKINSYKKIFDNTIKIFHNLLSILKIDLKLTNKALDELLYSAFIYLTYSLVDCAVEKTLELILKDPEYDNKVKMIMNNTKLFSSLKSLIMKECGNLTSDFIGLINGMTPPLGKD